MSITNCKSFIRMDYDKKISHKIWKKMWTEMSQWLGSTRQGLSGLPLGLPGRAVWVYRLKNLASFWTYKLQQSFWFQDDREKFCESQPRLLDFKFWEEKCGHVNLSINELCRRDKRQKQLGLIGKAVQGQSLKNVTPFCIYKLK